MPSFIRRLYNSDQFLFQIFKPTESYQADFRAFEDAHDALCDTLTPQQAEALEKVLERNCDVTEYETDDAFRVGFCIGARLMLEVLSFDEL